MKAEKEFKEALRKLMKEHDVFVEETSILETHVGS